MQIEFFERRQSCGQGSASGLGVILHGWWRLYFVLRERLDIFCRISVAQGGGVSCRGFFYNRRFDVVSEENKNGEGFDASLQDEDCGFGGADGSCCRGDHDELECCFSPDY